MACVLLWLIAAAVAVELWARSRREPEMQTPATIPFSVQQARDLFPEVYARYSAEWPYPLPVVPDLAEIAPADEPQREQIAKLRAEWILLLDRTGTVHKTYGVPPAVLESPEWEVPFTVSQLPDSSFVKYLTRSLEQYYQGALPPPETVSVQTETNADTLYVEWFKTGEAAAGAALRSSIYRHDLKRFKPNTMLKTFTSTVMMEQFSTNSLGYRGPEIVVPKPEGAVRIACLGGSTTVWGFTDALTYPAMLQHLLRERYPESGNRIEVVNCGVFGLNSREEVAMMEELVLLEPDILVYYNFVNDLSLHFAPWLHGDAARHSLLERLKSGLRKSTFLDDYANEWLLPAAPLLNRFLRETTLQNLEVVAASARRYGMQPAFCSFAGLAPEQVLAQDREYAEQVSIRPVFPDLSLESYTRIRTLYNRELKVFCAREGARYIPVAETIQAGYDLFMDECHFNPRGTEQQAQVVFKHIRDLVEARL